MDIRTLSAMSRIEKILKASQSCGCLNHIFLHEHLQYSLQVLLSTLAHATFELGVWHTFISKERRKIPGPRDLEF
jgi:hypothetical protein